MAVLFSGGKFHAENAAGSVPGALLNTYAAGGLTPLATYTDQGGASENTNPVVCDSDGYASVWLGAASYRMILQDSDGLTIWDEDNITPTVTAAAVVFTQDGAGAVERTVTDKLTESVSVLDFIPVSEHAAIAAYTSTLDVTDYFNAAIAAAAVVKVPAGVYRVLRPINMSARRNNLAAYWGRKLIGDGRGKTLIDGYTGVYPIVDFTGTSSSTLHGVWLRSDNPSGGLSASDCASIGVMFSRGTTGDLTTGSNQCRLEDVQISLTSAMARNGGYGTVGLLNHAAEHTSGDNVNITANLPVAMHNTMGFAIARSGDIPGYGIQYEAGATGAGASTRIHTWTNVVLIAYDSFRLLWLSQAGQFHMPGVYGSTRQLVEDVPANGESAYIWDSQLINIDMFQEVSGLFGATYRQDHAYLRLGGGITNLNVRMERAPFDMGFTNPGANSPSILLENDTYLNSCDINCNYNIGVYNEAGIDASLANEAIAMVSGSPNFCRNSKFTLDSVVSRTTGNALNPFTGGLTNVESINFLSGLSYGLRGTFVPTIIGLSSAGTGTYSTHAGIYSRVGNVCFFTLNLAWSAHTGTGNMAIAGLPFTSDATFGSAVAATYNGLVVDAGTKQLVAIVDNNATQISLYKADVAGGAIAAVAMDTAVTGLVVSGSYLIHA